MLRLRPAAQSDLSDIWDYSAERWNVEQAQRYLSMIWDRLTGLSDGSTASVSADEVLPGYRRSFAGSHVIYFRQTGRDLDVVRVLHQSMDPRQRFDA